MIIQILQSDDSVTVFFRLSSSIWADSVYLVGDFNEWSTSATPMRRGEQYWEARLSLKPGGRYYYAYLLDGMDWCSETLPHPRVEAEPVPITFLPIEIAQARACACAD
jgi:1,4-alpha-glucan branching enzyme